MMVAYGRPVCVPNALDSLPREAVDDTNTPEYATTAVFDPPPPVSKAGVFDLSPPPLQVAFIWIASRYRDQLS